MRSDIYWASRRWREASEQIELYYADRWRDFKPLNPAEKGDVIRALIGYALAEDAIGLARFREKYAPLMSGDDDRAAFETASQPAAADSAEFAPIAKMAASVDTLDGFLREMRTRFPGCDREGDAAAGNSEGRSGADRLIARDRRIEASASGEIARLTRATQSVFQHKGAFRDRHERWAGDAMDASSAKDESAILRTANNYGDSTARNPG